MDYLQTTEEDIKKALKKISHVRESIVSSDEPQYRLQGLLFIYSITNPNAKIPNENTLQKITESFVNESFNKCLEKMLEFICRVSFQKCIQHGSSFYKQLPCREMCTYILTVTCQNQTSIFEYLLDSAILPPMADCARYSNFGDTQCYMTPEFQV